MQAVSLQEILQRKHHVRSRKERPARVVNENDTSIDSPRPPERSVDVENQGAVDIKRETADAVGDDEAAYAQLVAYWYRASNATRIKFIEHLIQHWSQWAIEG